MGKLLEDLTGVQFGRLLAAMPSGYDCSGQPMWLCHCYCGNKVRVRTSNLKAKKTLSCGCLKIKHGQSGTRVYHCWAAIFQRCYNPKNDHYPRYGGRGITVSKEWSKFINFFNWAHKNGYQDHLTIDRINNDGNYDPSNCRWATRLEQSQNQERSCLFSGVYKNKNTGKWIARSSRQKGCHQKHLGSFKTHLAACYRRHSYDCLGV